MYTPDALGSMLYSERPIGARVVLQHELPSSRVLPWEFLSTDVPETPSQFGDRVTELADPLTDVVDIDGMRVLLL